MTEVEEAVARLQSIGGTLWLEGERLLYRLRAVSPEGVRLLEILRCHKPEVAAMLLERQGQESSPSSFVDCAHCGGTGACTCPACNLRRTSEPAPCCTCRSSDHQAWAAETMEQTCWHCAGIGACNCIECGQYKARMEWAAGPCLSCEARKPHPVQ